MPDAFLITRGHERKHDYDFCGPVPSELWWSPLSQLQLVDLNQADAIAYGDGRSLHVLVSGIPSARSDFLGRSIRHTLVVENVHEDVPLACRIVLAGLREDDRQALGRRLDEVFTEEAIVALRTSAEDAEFMRRLLRPILSGGWEAETADTSSLPADAGRSWAGPIGDERARAKFLSRVQRLGNGGAGFAFTSSLLRTREQVEADSKSLPGITAVLLADGELDEVVPLGKALPAVPDQQGRLTAWVPARPPTIAAAGAAAALLIAILIVLLIMI